MSINLFKIKQKLISEGRRFVVANIAIETLSSLKEAALVPQAGSKIILTDDGQAFGTTGNDEIDEEITNRLREFVHEKGNNSVLVIQSLSEIQKKSHFRNAQSLKILIERFEPTRRLVIVGAGEIGLTIARLAASLDFSIIIVDERADLANQQRFPMADLIICESDLLKALSLIPFDESCYIVIAFQANDDRAIRYCLNRPWAYCGLLGSKNRIKAIWEKLRSEGASEERLEAVHAPIGFDIGAQSPQEIAIAVLAEVVAVKNKDH